MKRSVIFLLLAVFAWTMSLSEPRLVDNLMKPEDFRIDSFGDLGKYLQYRVIDHFAFDYKIPGNDNPETFRGTFLFKIVFSYDKKCITNVELLREKSTPEQDARICESIKNMKLYPLDFQLKEDADSVFYINIRIKPQFY